MRIKINNFYHVSKVIADTDDTNEDNNDIDVPVEDVWTQAI